ncbi:hypothetical protein JZ751_020192 [Albula glossodonta]|uniref:Integrin alpha-2 domain-containing protein n=1 Tax=Albula glossodonta TaxID=121402 RepID=A0A8T2NX67_9TELE|nr:hypothetical protein JZ751_020192 [Albula glossodonta]
MGITQTFSQRISGLGNDFMMFGQSISGGIDVDDNSYPDIAVGAYLSDSVVVLRTRAVVVMEAFMLLPPSFNRTVLRCYANGQLQACINISVCFKVQGGRISGLIGLLYNLTADTKHLDSYPSRFYFGGNPMFTAVTGQVKVKPENLTCVSHSAAMRRIVRDIFTPITFELTYELGEHSVDKETSRNFSALKPILQQRADKSNQVFNQTKFARYCVWPNCSTNLQVSADLVLPQSYNNLSYFALGTLETIRLNVIIFNAGDDAFLPRVHLTFPRNLYFIKALDPEEKHVRCEVNERDEALVELECSVGNLYIDSMAKHNITFLLDVVQSSDAGDLNITVSGTW